jgi:glycosyltransferase involved in cell wall biosynthesis
MGIGKVVEMIGIWRINRYIGGTEKSLIDFAYFLRKWGYEVRLYGSPMALDWYAKLFGFDIFHEDILHKDYKNIKLLFMYDEPQHTVGKFYHDELKGIENRIFIYGGMPSTLLNDDTNWGKKALVKTYKIRDWLIQKSRYNEEQIKICQIPLPLHYWKCNGETINYDLGYIGRDSQFKNTSALWKLYDRFKKSNISYITQWATTTMELNRLWQSGKQIKINCTVKPEFYSEMRLFISLSLEEGVSRTIMEAMACERPIICYDVGGTHELHPNWFFAPRNEGVVDEEIVEVINGLLEQPELLRVAGIENRRRIEFYNKFLEEDLKEYVAENYERR